MTLSMHSASVPVFARSLRALGKILAKAETYSTDNKIDPNALLGARLFPDMLPMRRQVQIACDFAKGVPGRLADDDMPAFEDNETSFAELQERINKTLAYIEGIDAAKFDGSEQRQIVLRPGTPKEKTFTGEAYLLAYGIPQFFFHVTTAYALLRHNGLAIGKLDYMGAN